MIYYIYIKLNNPIILYGEQASYFIILLLKTHLEYEYFSVKFVNILENFGSSGLLETIVMSALHIYILWKQEMKHPIYF